ncbi:hypothetical protein [Duganella callida]|nr:hypothetical protein [Duganella callida]
MSQPQQPAHDDKPMDVEPAHVMSHEKHRQREHYERMLRELREERRK